MCSPVADRSSPALARGSYPARSHHAQPPIEQSRCAIDRKRSSRFCREHSDDVGVLFSLSFIVVTNTAALISTQSFCLSWTKHKTNDRILRQLNLEKELLRKVRFLKLGCYGHMTRKCKFMQLSEKGYNLLQGCAAGNRNRGRQRIRWSEDISEWTELHTSETARTAEDRGRWRRVARAANTSSGGQHYMTTFCLHVL